MVVRWYFVSKEVINFNTIHYVNSRKFVNDKMYKVNTVRMNPNLNLSVEKNNRHISNNGAAKNKVFSF